MNNLHDIKRGLRVDICSSNTEEKQKVLHRVLGRLVNGEWQQKRDQDSAQGLHQSQRELQEPDRVLAEAAVLKDPSRLIPR